MNANEIIEREQRKIDSICDKYHYDSNIRHLLYLMIPAFIIKYGISKERLILNTFEDIQIVISDEKNKYVKAYYSSTPKKVGDSYTSEKYMLIYDYQNIGLIDLLDNLVHEFNHAVNSYQNEIRVTPHYVILRTGLTYRAFQKEDLSFVKKHDSYILEEIINTKQTSDIINIMKGFHTLNSSLSNTIYAINSETEHQYNSNSYYLQSYACKEILNNRTFISTLEKLRLSGEVYELSKWFDDIVGKRGTYKELIRLLREVYDMEYKYATQSFFKTMTLSKIRDLTSQILRIVEKFNNSVNYR